MKTKSKQMLLNPSIQFFMDTRGLLLIERKVCVTPKFKRVLNSTLFSYAIQTPKTCRLYIQNLLLLRKLFTSLHSTFVDKLS